MALRRLTKRPKSMASFVIETSQTVYIGDYVMVSGTTGRVVGVADIVSGVPLGLVVGFDPPNIEVDGGATGNAAASKPPEAIVDIEGGKVLDIAVTGITGNFDIGKKIYATAAQTLTLSATSNINAVGQVLRRISGTTVDIILHSMETVSRS